MSKKTGIGICIGAGVILVAAGVLIILAACHIGPFKKKGDSGNEVKTEIVRPEYMWDFEKVAGDEVSNVGNISNAGNIGVGNGVLKGEASVGSERIMINGKAYSDADNKVLILPGGKKGTAYVELPADIYKHVTADSGFTYSFFIKPDNEIASYSRIISSADGSNSNEFAYTAYAKDSVWNVIFDDNDSVKAVSAEPVKGEWSLVTFTVSRSGIDFYINGKYTSSAANDALEKRLENIETLVNNAIGKTCSGWIDDDAKAVLDNVCLYKKALTETEIAAIAKSYGFNVDASDKNGDASENKLADGTVLDDVSGLAVTNDNISAKIVTDSAKGRFYITSSCKNKVVLNASQLGITLDNIDFTEGMTYVPDSCRTSSGTDKYTLTTGAYRDVTDEYNEINFELKKDEKILNVTVRAYEHGIAYRYVLSGNAGESAKVKGEASEFVLPGDSVIWTGFDGAGNYEYHYSKMNMTSVKISSADYSAPLLANSGDMWMLYTEAAVFSEENTYCASALATEKGSANLHFKFGKAQTSAVNMVYDDKGNFHTPWRVVIASDNLNDIVNSTVVTSLNPEPDSGLYADINDWLLTGKVAWSWWSEAGDDPVEYAQQKDYIDFASQNGWEYVCIDFGWCLWDDYQTKIKELVDYGKERNVAIVLWYGVNNDNHSGFKDSVGAAAYPKYSVKNAKQLEEQFSWCYNVGVKGVKVDYFEQDDEDTMNLMYNVATIAAKYKLNVLFHGCTSPKGEHRTFPNVVGYEAVLGGEGYKWNNGASVFDALVLMFSRNVVGGMDFTPIGTKVTQLNTTAGFALAQLVAYQSGFVNVASSVYKLEGYSGLAYINDVPVTWDETRVIEGYPGLYCTIARRNGEDWYIGSMTASKKDVSINLDFLGDGDYTAYIYGDNEDGTNVRLRTEKVTNKSQIELKLMTDGGAAVKISKNEMKTDTIYDGYTFYEAEDNANILSGNASVNVNQFASGMKQVANIGGTLSDTLTFNNIKVNTAGVYEMRLYFACGIEKRIEYSINGKERIRSTGLSSGVNTLGMKVFYVELQAGDNTIVFGNSLGSAPNVDRIAISASPADKEPTGSDESGVDTNISEGAKLTYTAYGPENAKLEGGARIENGGIGWLGNSASCKATYTVNVENAGKYKLQIKYYAGETRNVYVGVNGGDGEKIECPNTGSYGIDSTSYVYIDAELNAGENTVVLGNSSGWCPNIAGIGVSTTTVAK